MQAINESSERIPKQQRIPSLDGLRGVSITLVLYGHLCGTRNFWITDGYRYFGDVANLGVRVFFVISGFLITSLLLKELDVTGRISLTHFYFRRLLRIFPVAYCYVAAVLIGSAAGLIWAPREDVVRAVTFTVNFGWVRSWYLKHLWSLSVEEQFYLVWPAVLCLLGRRRAFRIAILVIAVLPVLRILWTLSTRTQVLLWFFASFNADSLLIGSLLAGFQQQLHSSSRYEAFLKQSRTFYAVPIAVLLLNWMPHPWFFIPLMNFGIAVCIDRWTTYPFDAAARFLNSGPVRALGLISYSLYLWQMPFLNPVTVSTRWNSFPVNLVLAMVCGYGSYKLVEVPSLALRGRIERWRDSRWAHAAAAAG